MAVKQNSSAKGNAEHVQKIRKYISGYLPLFPELKKVNNIENILLAQQYYESSYNPAARSPVNGSRKGSVGFAYVTDPIYVDARDNLLVPLSIREQGLQGWGLGQILGSYLYKGSKNGQEFLQTKYKTIASQLGLIIPIGTDLETVFTHDDMGIVRGVISQMIVLDHKYSIYRKNGKARDNWEAFTLGLASYLGNPFKEVRDINGSSPRGYAAKILTKSNSPPMLYYKKDKTQIASTNSNAVAKPAPGC